MRYKSKTSDLVVIVHEITDDYVQWEGLEDFPTWGHHRTVKSIFMDSMEPYQEGLWNLYP